MNYFLLALWDTIDFWTMSVIVIFVLFVYVVFRLDRAPDSSFKFHDFFTSGDWNGKASSARLCYFGAFLAHSLVLLHQQMKPGGGVDYPMASLYALIWSGAYVALKAIELKTQQPQGENYGQEGTGKRSDAPYAGTPQQAGGGVGGPT